MDPATLAPENGRGNMRGQQQWWRSAVVVAALVALGSVAPAAAATGTTKTKTATVYPWTSAGKLKAGLKVAGTVEGLLDELDGRLQQQRLPVHVEVVHLRPMLCPRD